MPATRRAPKRDRTGPPSPSPCVALRAALDRAKAEVGELRRARRAAERETERRDVEIDILLTKISALDERIRALRIENGELLDIVYRREMRADDGRRR